MCGEHDEHRPCAEESRGSSPRVRGTHINTLFQDVAIGIIPACAGNTLHEILRRQLGRDHPRVCGEHHAWFRACRPQRGSSPRVRGTLRDHLIDRVDIGIIPACAGNTNPVVYSWLKHGDHPRVCGEHELTMAPVHVPMGSSPRVRGTQASLCGYQVDPGIIPACAGNTNCSTVCKRASRDHPRVCGEHGSSVAPFARYGGSSPRVRGTHAPLVLDTDTTGIIPACAGNTCS